MWRRAIVQVARAQGAFSGFGARFMQINGASQGCYCAVPNDPSLTLTAVAMVGQSRRQPGAHGHGAGDRGQDLPRDQEPARQAWQGRCLRPGALSVTLLRLECAS